MTTPAPAKQGEIKADSVWGDDDEAATIDAQIVSLDAGQLNNRTRMLDNNIKVMRSELNRLTHEVKAQQDKIKDNSEKIKMNKQLPYLVSNVIEILNLEPETDEDGAAMDTDAKSTKAVVIKTSTRQTIFLPVVGLVDPAELKPGDLVGVNKDSYLILDTLPTEYDSRVKAMEVDEKPTEDYTDVGGLDKQIQELVEAVVRPMTHADLFKSIGIKPPKGVLMYGPPGVGKTLMARACAAKTNAMFLKLAAPQLVQMFIGDGAKLVRDAFALAREKAPAIIFIDELDAIGTKRFDSDKSGDREVQRTMLELLNQLDGFSSDDRIKVIAATNRPDILDPALLRSGRLDRKIEFPLPDEDGRANILRIHSNKMNVNTESVNYEELARCTDDFNGAMLKAVCVTGDHRVLTHTGWRSITKMKVGDVVLSFNTTTYVQEWKRVTALQCFVVDPEDVNHKLYRMQGAGMDVVATRDHRMLTAKLSEKTVDGLQKVDDPVGYELVSELLPPALTYAAKSHSKVTQFKHCQVRGVVCAGFNQQPGVKIVIPGLERVCDWWWQTDGQASFLAFLGFWLGDGWLDVSHGFVCIGQKKAESVDWLGVVLAAVFPNWWYRNTNSWDADKYNYTIRCPPLYNYLRLMAIGPLGYNPRDPAEMRSYPHFTYDASLAAMEQQSGYHKVDNSINRVSTWTEEEMLAAFGPVRVQPVPPYVAMRATAATAAADDAKLNQEEAAPLDVVDAATAQAMQAVGAIVWWNNGAWIVINGHWYYLKRWMGDAAQMASVYSQLSREQAIALLDGFCRADGVWTSIKYDENGQPTGQWRCSNSSVPLLDHISLIAQLAGASVDMHRHYKAGRTTIIGGRTVSHSVDHWALFFTFTQSKRPFQWARLAEPVDVSAGVAGRGNYMYVDDGKVYDITVEGNSNFLTHRLAYKRIQTGREELRAHAVFVGNCVEAGMLALRRDATELNHEDFMAGIGEVQAKKKANLNYYA